MFASVAGHFEYLRCGHGSGGVVDKRLNKLAEAQGNALAFIGHIVIVGFLFDDLLV